VSDGYQSFILDSQVVEEMMPWKEILDEVGSRPIGWSNVYLQQQECAFGECNLGNFYTDAMLHAVNVSR